MWRENIVLVTVPVLSTVLNRTWYNWNRVTQLRTENLQITTLNYSKGSYYSNDYYYILLKLVHFICSHAFSSVWKIGLLCFAKRKQIESKCALEADRYHFLISQLSRATYISSVPSMSLSALLLVHVSPFRAVSIEYCKTKFKFITLANHKVPWDRQWNEPIKT